MEDQTTLLYQYYCGFISFIIDVIHSRYLIWTLAKRDFQSRYLGSYLGLVWAFVQPLVSILVLWFVFEVGFKAQPVQGVPFILWLMAGMIPWFFIADALASGAGAILDQSFLVKKVAFRVSILPVVKVVSSAIIHGFFLILLFLVFWLYGYPPRVSMLGAIYYSLAACILALGVSWLTSAVHVFVRDTSQVVSILVQFGFWLTPIFWSLSAIPVKYHWILKLNPAYYIIQGYRDSFIYGQWPSWQDSLYFWLVTGMFFALGAIIFKRLRPHFADVL